MQQPQPKKVLEYGSGTSWRDTRVCRSVHRVVAVCVTVAVAYSLPLAVYATWAWSRLRPETWPADQYPAMDPLGLAWQYWHPTPSVGPGGDSYWAAEEQGERWRNTALAAVGVLAASVFVGVLWWWHYRRAGSSAHKAAA
jgi:hypothetical protein